MTPLKFKPIFKDRVWGGRRLQELFGKPLPPGPPVGESWEISDRPGDVSVVANGPLAGRDLHSILQEHGPALLGNARAEQGRFPLLIKLLDAREKLSLQVHPPAAKASALNGEPKTEMWYIADAEPGAKLYVGLRHGVTRSVFEESLKSGRVEHCFHQVHVKTGDCMLLPSGRVHAIGAGLVIFEIQQNSDTTYRVFDWNRLGLDGKPRALHIRESLESINFDDFEPALLPGNFTGAGPAIRPLVRDPLFTVDARLLKTAESTRLPGGQMQILGVVSGTLHLDSQDHKETLSAGEFVVLPAALALTTLYASHSCTYLQIQA